MTMTVSLGLKNLFYGAEKEEEHVAAIRSLVDQGFTTLVREVIGKRVFEASATQADWLEGKAAKKVLDAITKLHEKYDTFASFSWDEVENLGCYETANVALVRDGTNEDRRLMLDGAKLSITDAGRSLLMNWKGSRHAQAKIAAAMHRLAIKHRLIVWTA